MTGHVVDESALLQRLRGWAAELGFSRIGVAGIDLASAEPGFAAWLQQGLHGDMAYLARHGSRRSRPAELVPGTLAVITARMDYLPRRAGGDAASAADDDAEAGDGGWRAVEWRRLATPSQATVSLYARGRDYHKVLRTRLRQLADRLTGEIGPFGYRVFTDSAPVLEVELASRSGLGWRGKHTLVLDRDAGSMFFLGEIYVDLPLTPTPPVTAHCGSCRACIDICPTAAIVDAWRIDARRCISYLTIEHHGPIPVELRPLLGNRIYGCDDCQLVCPWNRHARRSPLPDFDVREPLGDAALLQLWQWDEAAFLRHTEGSAIRRIGYERWRRNLAVALGNARRDPALREAVSQALQDGRDGASPLVREHIDWALSV